MRAVGTWGAALEEMGIDPNPPGLPAVKKYVASEASPEASPESAQKEDSVDFGESQHDASYLSGESTDTEESGIWHTGHSDEEPGAGTAAQSPASSRDPWVRWTNAMAPATDAGAFFQPKGGITRIRCRFYTQPPGHTKSARIPGNLDPGMIYGPILDSGLSRGYRWVQLALPDNGMMVYVNIWQQSPGRDRGTLFARIIPAIPPAPSSQAIDAPDTRPPLKALERPSWGAQSSYQGRAGSSGDRPAAEPTQTGYTWSADRDTRATDAWAGYSGWDASWSHTSRWVGHERGTDTWSRQQWSGSDASGWRTYPTQRTPEPEPPWANWGGVTTNEWPWGTQLYRSRVYTWKKDDEYPGQGIKRLMSELGCFFVEAWHAYLAHYKGKAASNDPKLNTEEDCRAFLQLIQENDYDVRIAMKKARIQVDWHKAARNLKSGSSAATRYTQRG